MGKNRTFIIAAILIIVCAFLITSCSSGSKEKKGADARNLLNKIVQSIEELEKENRDLKADLAHADKSKITRDNKSLREEIATLKQENKELQKQVGMSKGLVAHKDLQLESGESRSARINELEKENNALQIEISRLNGLVAHRELQLESRGEKSPQIAQMEKDNNALQEQVSKLKGLLSFTRLQLESKDDRKGYITELENKNKELSTLLDKINKIAADQTKGSGPVTAP